MNNLPKLVPSTRERLGIPVLSRDVLFRFSHASAASSSSSSSSSPLGGSIRWPLHLCRRRRRPLLIFGCSVRRPSVVAPRRISCAIAFCGRPFVSIDASLPRTISCFHYHSAALNQMCIFQPENAINCTFGYNTSAIIIL